MKAQFKSEVDNAGWRDLQSGSGSVYRHRPTLHASWEFEDGVKVSVSEETNRTWYPSRGRSYIERVRTTKPRVYVDAAQPFNVLEDLTNRTRRPHTAWKPRVIEALARVGITGGKLHWNQRAGCSCGCSPGFILDGIDFEQVTLSVTLPGAPTVDESLPGRDIV
jgi:hypothetical protein